MTDGRYEAAHQFLTNLFGAVEATDRILIWTVKGATKASHWPTGVDAAARLAVDFDKQTQVYVGCGWRPDAYGRDVRGDSEHVGGIPGLWVDLDVACAGHQGGKTYAPSFEVAREMIRKLPAQPSIVVNTGGGFHLWWLFTEPFRIETPEDRKRASRLLTRWEATVRQHASEMGFTLDSVHDLARVLRVPGTWRSKPDAPEPILCEVEAENAHRYEPDDFDQWFVEEVYGGRQVSSATVQVGEIVLSLEAQPPFDKFMALAEIEPRFKLTFDGKRKFAKDSSQSAFDLALATYAAQAQWADQEIANLIVAARRNVGADLKKAMRQDYIKDRIMAARASVLSKEIDEKSRHSTLVEKVERAKGLEELDEAVDRGAGSTEILAYLSEQLGIPILGLTQATRHNPFYELRVGGDPEASVVIGPTDALINPVVFRKRIAGGCQMLIRRFKAEEWDRITRAFLRIVQVTDSDGSSRLGQVEEWIEQYMAEYRRRPSSNGSVGSLVGRNEPFVKDGEMNLHLGAFLKWLKLKEFNNTERSDIISALRSLSYRPHTISWRDTSGKVSSRTYWSRPECSNDENAPNTQNESLHTIVKY